MSHKDPFSQRESQNYENPVASRELLLSIIENSAQALTFKALCDVLNYTESSQEIGVKRRLRAMENSGQLFFNKFKQYVITPKASILTGRVIGHRDGFGFFAPNSGGKDLYISSFEMKRVFHGDVTQAILLDADNKKGRKEVRILEVVEPRKTAIVGRYFVQHHTASVIPDDARIQQEILINPVENQGARHGQMVVVEIVQRPNRRNNAVGKIVEVLGDRMAPGMEIQIALREHELPYEWSQAVLDEVNGLSDEVDDEAKIGRKDLRDLPLVTIDGEDARDFDDAVYCETKKSGGWRLWVAIADVSYYVRPETALDEEAIGRGNSVYFPSQVIPMLPEKLSNGLCSLNPDVDRLCMVCEMTISAAGKLSGSKFYPALMRSHARFTYTKVAAILDGDKALNQQYASLVPDLNNLNQMYHSLTQAREKRGAIAFETNESRFIFNDDKKIESIVPLIRNDAHKIIEECMILANVATAKFVEKHQAPGLFRVHNKPGQEKYKNFIRYLGELGIEVPQKDQPDPADYGEILSKIAGRPDQELIQTMLLRSMKQAVYQSDNQGHFGLALTAYSHFTSPIRRYPDLVIHRVIKAILQKQQPDPVNQGQHAYPLEGVVMLGEHCSKTERRADDATRDVADWLKCEYMQDHVGDHFSGVISTVTNFGLFVRLSDLHIEGLVHISSLSRDYYRYDEVRMCLTGEKSGIKYHVGDVLDVQVAAVNLDQKKIDLTLGTDGDSAAKSPNKGKAKAPRRSKTAANNSQESSKNKADTKPKSTAKPNSTTKSKTKTKPKPKPKSASKAKTAPDSKTEKSKAAKRKARKKRPGKNAREQENKP